MERDGYESNIDGQYKKITEYEDRWTVLEGLLVDKPIFTRYKEGLVPAIGHDVYPIQLGIAVPFLSPTANGLPTPEEGIELAKIEDTLKEVMESDNEAILAMVITYNNMREFVFYASVHPSEFFKERLKRIEEHVTTAHEFQFIAQEDRGWETFKKYSGME